MQKQRWVLVAAAPASFLVSLDALVVTAALALLHVRPMHRELAAK